MNDSDDSNSSDVDSEKGHKHYKHKHYGLKLQIPYFNGEAEVEECLDWFNDVEAYFEAMEVPRRSN